MPHWLPAVDAGVNMLGASSAGSKMSENAEQLFTVELNNYC